MADFISVMVWSAANGGLLSTNALCLEAASMFMLSMESMELALEVLVAGLLNSSMVVVAVVVGRRGTGDATQPAVVFKLAGATIRSSNMQRNGLVESTPRGSVLGRSVVWPQRAR